MEQISDRTDLSFDEAKVEYVLLLARRNTKHFPSSSGWNQSTLDRFDFRLNFLRVLITDFVVKDIEL